MWRFGDDSLHLGSQMNRNSPVQNADQLDFQHCIAEPEDSSHSARSESSRVWRGRRVSGAVLREQRFCNDNP
jgi:hypothetical protein